MKKETENIIIEHTQKRHLTVVEKCIETDGSDFEMVWSSI